MGIPNQLSDDYLDKIKLMYHTENSVSTLRAQVMSLQCTVHPFDCKSRFPLSQNGIGCNEEKIVTSAYLVAVMRRVDQAYSG